ncbi:MAG: dienelactone hydrolase family protein [Chloroflexi bacterium]|nr:dienelactone hydrolase family protein [Chloroflexota bacterium]
MPRQPEQFDGPHQGQPVMGVGQSLEDAAYAMILIHGRGASARDILTLSLEFNQDDIAYLAPEANGYQWYPMSFLAPIEQNEPYLSSALVLVDDIVAKVVQNGIPPDHIFLGGFSQGACLTLEYVARNARRYAGVLAFSGGVIGPDETPRDYGGSLDGTPIFLGCSDVDPHIPLARVNETAAVMEKLGARVDKRIYEGMGHAINHDEIEAARQLIAGAIVP